MLRLNTPPPLSNRADESTNHGIIARPISALRHPVCSPDSPGLLHKSTGYTFISEFTERTSLSLSNPQSKVKQQSLAIMSLIALSIRLLRLLPAIASTWVLGFALDEHLIFGTWMHPSLRENANTNLPAWWTKGGLRWRWVIILGYPLNYVLGVLNLLIDRHELQSTGSTSWYTMGLVFSLAHMAYLTTALEWI
ncbi:hypothetical protein CSAL01_13057, partial [Colletotrichum salicis]